MRWYRVAIAAAALAVVAVAAAYLIGGALFGTAGPDPADAKQVARGQRLAQKTPEDSKERAQIQAQIDKLKAEPK